MIKFTTVAVAVLVTCGAYQASAYAAVLPTEIPKTRAVNAIIGEAEGEGYAGMLAVACAIRNRGTLKGVYGEKAVRVLKRKYSASVFVHAVKAWEESANPDNCTQIDGATHWEGTAFKTPYWASSMILTATIGNQRFYMEK